MAPLEIAGLTGLTVHELRITWRHWYKGEAPARLSRDLLVRAIAYRMQERAQGGLAPATRRLLLAQALEIETRGKDAFDPGIALKPGTRLVREWGGRPHTVIVRDDGFDYAGEHYPSLTRIAARITGAHWSGPRFFGLGRRRRGDAE